MPNPKVEAYMFAAVAQIGEGTAEVNAAIRAIGARAAHGNDPLPYQLLAARRYLRIGGKKLHANWSWSAEQAAVEMRNEPTKTLYKEADKVREAFRLANPGYQLIVSPLRDLDKQIHLWNSNSTVGPAGARLLRDIAELLASPDFPDVPAGAHTARFASRLRNSVVAPEPSSAAPGTSNHGRGTAVDFVVQTVDGRDVVGTNSREIEPKWKNGGWEKKLINACRGSKLKGPLQHPYEPWHWELK
jgi:hypothetical protein